MATVLRSSPRLVQTERQLPKGSTCKKQKITELWNSQEALLLELVSHELLLNQQK
jgi:hypothetical protein